jgi:hypothetical protein
MAEPFIRIVDGKLSQVGFSNITKLENMQILSILGKGRMGKSSFLNSIITSIMGTNQNIFKTSDGDEHCTYGIDAYVIPKTNIIILDSKGLAYEDASHDPALLLFVYLISDVIIFNERMMLQNEALRLLEPMCTFMNYVEIEDIVKPTLFFRISDGHMVNDPVKNLEKVLKSHPDQYQSIRESIVHLFANPIKIVKTEQLDRRTLKILSQNEYDKLIIQPDTGFQEAINSILTCVGDEIEPKLFYKVKLSEIINSINTNDKININKLDIIGTTAKVDIHEYIDKIDPTMYSLIEVDGTQKSYLEKVETRIKSMKSYLTIFTNRFKLIAKTIRDPFYQKVEKRFLEPIESATKTSSEKARVLIEKYRVAASQNGLLANLYSTTKSFYSMGTNINEICRQHMKDIAVFEKECAKVYDPVRKECMEWINARYNEVSITFNECIENEKQMIQSIQIFCSEQISNFPTWFKDLLNSHPSIINIRTNDLIELFKKDKLTAIQEGIKSCITLQTISITMKDNKLICKKDNKLKCTDINYDLVGNMYKKTMESIIELYKDPSIETNIIAEKEFRLKNVIIRYNPKAEKSIFSQNPEITFVKDTIAINNIIGYDCYMTTFAFESLFNPLYKKAIQKIVGKGYCNHDLIKTHIFKHVWNGTAPISSNIKCYTGYDGTYKYIINVYQLFIHNVIKFHCKEVVANQFKLEEIADM